MLCGEEEEAGGPRAPLVSLTSYFFCLSSASVLPSGTVLLFLKKIIFFTYSLLVVLGLRGCTGSSLVAASRGLLSSYGLWASPGAGFSCCKARAL